MPNQKNQHYVPRVLLRRWSTSGQENIRTVILKDRRIIPAAPIKGQCSRSYMYGQDLEIEKMLGTVEGNAKKAFEFFAHTNIAPLAHSEERVALLLFMLLQKSRTEAAFKTDQKMFADMMKHVYGSNLPPELRDVIAQYDTNAEQAKLFVATTMPNLPFLFDLSMRVLTPSDGCEFVIGDNPTIPINQAFHRRLKNVSAIGWAMSGIQTFLPIAPDAVVMLYDRRIYRVGNRRDSFRVKLNAHDTKLLNSLQVLNALSTIYISPNLQESILRELLKDAMPLKQENRIRIIEFPNPERNSSIVGTSLRDLNVDLNWSFCTVKKNSKQLIAPEGWGPRDRAFLEQHRAVFERQIKDVNALWTIMWKMIQHQNAAWKAF